MSDQLIRAISQDGLIKVSAVSTRDLTERARQIHKTLPVATAALGRLLAAASMMGNALKGDGASLTLRVQGGGPLGILLAVSDNRIVILLIMNVILLIAGTFMDVTPAILIFTPLFLPIVKTFGMHPVHFGLLLVTYIPFLSIGLPTAAGLI